jgi:RecJ-like exonuclease
MTDAPAMTSPLDANGVCERCRGSGDISLNATCPDCDGTGRAPPAPSHTAVEPVADEDRMLKISKVIAELLEIKQRFGDTCVYIRRGGMSWGAVALNREADDKKHGVFDLQAQHDRDMLARVEQNQRLIDDNRELRGRVHNAEAALTAQAAALVAAERERDEALAEATKWWLSDCRSLTERNEARAEVATLKARVAELEAR